MYIIIVICFSQYTLLHNVHIQSYILAIIVWEICT